MNNTTATTKTAPKLDWLQHVPAADRVIQIRDLQESYFAAIDGDVSEDQIVDEFVRTYDFNDDSDDEPKPTREENEARLRDEITVSWISWTLSAPNKSGYRQEFTDLSALRAQAAEFLGCPVADLVENESGDGGTHYFYASQADAEADEDGAYAIQYRETEY